MIDIDCENLIDLHEAAKSPALRNPKNGKPAHLASLYRYIQHGARAANRDKIRLECVKTPRGTLTSREAITRFIERLTNPDLPTATPTQRRRQQAEAERELAAAGFELNDAA